MKLDHNRLLLILFAPLSSALSVHYVFNENNVYQSRDYNIYLPAYLVDTAQLLSAATVRKRTRQIP